MRSGDGAVDMSTNINMQTSMTAGDTLKSSVVSVTNVAASDIDTTVSVTSPTPLLAGQAMLLNVSASAAGLVFGLIRYTYRRPL